MTIEATSAERAIVDAWRSAEGALEAVRREELRSLTPEDALAAVDALLDLVRLLPDAPERLSGLVEQQRLFMRARA